MITTSNQTLDTYTILVLACYILGFILAALGIGKIFYSWWRKQKIYFSCALFFAGIFLFSLPVLVDAMYYHNERLFTVFSVTASSFLAMLLSLARYLKARRSAGAVKD